MSWKGAKYNSKKHLPTGNGADFTDKCMRLLREAKLYKHLSALPVVSLLPQCKTELVFLQCAGTHPTKSNSSVSYKDSAHLLSKPIGVVDHDRLLIKHDACRLHDQLHTCNTDTMTLSCTRLPGSLTMILGSSSNIMHAASMTSFTSATQTSSYSHSQACKGIGTSSNMAPPSTASHLEHK
eukprot:1158222-Pelagomonas_calceolata.AAC.4